MDLIEMVSHHIIQRMGFLDGIVRVMNGISNGNAMKRVTVWVLIVLELVGTLIPMETNMYFIQTLPSIIMIILTIRHIILMGNFGITLTMRLGNINDALSLLIFTND